jgi:hypothetical protein
MFTECQALFIFDQSSAHASHGDGALNAFAMNLNDGGRQPICKDTIFPRETLAVSTRIVLGGGAAQARTRAGEVQKMSFVDSEGTTVAKGLRTVLTVSRGARHTSAADVHDYRNEAACPRARSRLNVILSALIAISTAAWLAFFLSRRTFKTRNPVFSKPSKMLAISASFSQNFTVSSILSRWWVWCHVLSAIH